jgi:hypothetical protein
MLPAGKDGCVNIQVQWDNSEKTIILHTYPLHWEWQDVKAARAQSRLMLDTVSYKVHFIFDMQKSPRIPGNYMEQMKALNQGIHPNIGLAITVCSNPLVKDLFYVFSATVGGVDFEYRFARTVDDARAILRKWTGNL